MTQLIPLTFAMLLSLVLGVIDGRTGRMPNLITLGALFIALTGRFFLEGGAGLSSALLGVLLVGGVPLALYIFSGGRAIGGGDVKALAALGALLGPMAGLEVELGSFVLLALFALAMEAYNGRLLPLLLRSLWLILPQKVRAASTQREGGARADAAQEPMMFLRLGPFLAVGTMSYALSFFIVNWLSAGRAGGAL